MKINEILMQLLLRQPYFGYLASALTFRENDGTYHIKATYLPAPTIWYKRSWFECLSPFLAQGVVIHELLHLTLLHPARRNGRDILLWETACDLAVNSWIDPVCLADDAVTIERLASELGIVLAAGKSAEIYYDQLLQLEDGIGFLELESQIHIRSTKGNQMTINRQSGEELSFDSNEIQWKAFKSTLHQLVSESLSEGGIPDGLTLELTQTFSEYHVDWRMLFKRFLIGRGRIDSRRSYKRESKRYSGFPGNKRSIGLKCLLAIDESGSIQNHQIGEFYNEIVGINRITAAEIYVTQFDVSCTNPVLLGRAELGGKRLKSGGTDFRPIFELADRMRMELVVIFTDGDGTAPIHVNQRVLWVLTKGGRKPADYGFVAELN